MAPTVDAQFAEYLLPETSQLSRRDLNVNKTQAVTLGIIAVYVVVIALLWNIPYIRYVLWPFKVMSSAETLRFKLTR